MGRVAENEKRLNRKKINPIHSSHMHCALFSHQFSTSLTRTTR